jgi:hypothetical protein
MWVELLIVSSLNSWLKACQKMKNYQTFGNPVDHSLRLELGRLDELTIILCQLVQKTYPNSNFSLSEYSTPKKKQIFTLVNTQLTILQTSVIYQRYHQKSMCNWAHIHPTSEIKKNSKHTSYWWWVSSIRFFFFYTKNTPLTFSGRDSMKHTKEKKSGSGHDQGYIIPLPRKTVLIKFSNVFYHFVYVISVLTP